MSEMSSSRLAILEISKQKKTIELLKHFIRFWSWSSAIAYYWDRLCYIAKLLFDVWIILFFLILFFYIDSNVTFFPHIYIARDSLALRYSVLRSPTNFGDLRVKWWNSKLLSLPWKTFDILFPKSGDRSDDLRVCSCTNAPRRSYVFSFFMFLFYGSGRKNLFQI